MYSLSDLIIRTKLQNTTPHGCIGSDVWDTYDRIYLESISEFEKYANEDNKLNQCYPTGYAIINKAVPYKNQGELNWKLMENKYWLDRPACSYALRSNCDDKIAIVNKQGEIQYVDPNQIQSSLSDRLCMQLDLSQYSKIVKGLEKVGYWGSQFQINSHAKFSKPYMTLGEFPQIHACRNTTFYQEMNYNYCDLEKEEQVALGDLIPTGKTFTGCYLGDGKFTKGVEYEYNINWPLKLVRYQYDNDKVGYWVNVDPIKWDILNWDELPTHINPNGSGTTGVIKLRTQNVINCGIPVNLDLTRRGANYWCNSTKRAYYNGYNMQGIDHQNLKNLNNLILSGGNFEDQNFLNESMEIVQNLIEEVNMYEEKNKKKNQIKFKKNAIKYMIESNYKDIEKE